jgi:hypothetical protein
MRDFRYRGFVGLLGPAEFDGAVAARDAELRRRLAVTDFIPGHEGRVEFAGSVAQVLADWQSITADLHLGPAGE